MNERRKAALAFEAFALTHITMASATFLYQSYGNQSPEQSQISFATKYIFAKVAKDCKSKHLKTIKGIVTISGPTSSLNP